MFSCEFCEISKNTFLQKTSGRLLLYLFEYRRLVILFKPNIILLWYTSSNQTINAVYFNNHS